MSWTRGELRGADLRWLLTLTVRGTVYRFSTVTTEVTDGARTLLYRAGLQPLEVPDTIAPPGGTVEEPSARVEVRFSRATAAGWAALTAADRDPGDATAELALHVAGQEWSRRRVVLSGPIASAEGGALGEPLVLGLTEAPWRRTPRALPRESYRVSSATYSDTGYQIGDGVAKQLPAEVVGAPGYRDPNTGGSYPALPGLLALVDSSALSNAVNPVTIVIGVGALKAVGAASVKLFNASAASGAASIATFTPTLLVDGRGQTVTVINAPNELGGGLDIADGDELWIHFLAPATGGRPDTQGGVMRGADEVIRWLVEQSGARADIGRMASDLRPFRSWTLDFYLNSTVDPLELLLTEVVPLLPLSVRVGPGGLTLRRWPYDAVYEDAVAHLDMDRTTGERLGPVVRSDPSGVTNLLTIRYALNGYTDAYLAEFTFAPTKRVDQVDREVHPYARASADRYGEREGAPIESALIVDRQTAVAAVNWQIRHHSQTRESVVYQVPQEWQALTPGDVITVTDSAIGWDQRICVVVGVLLREGPTELSIEALPDWIRDAV